MARWNETCTLVRTEHVLDDEGVPQPHTTETEAFCNAFTVGMSTWSSMYEIGVSADAEIQLRTCDYEGQHDVIYRDKWYSVEHVEESGEFTRLVLRHQQSDSPEGGEEVEQQDDRS